MNIFGLFAQQTPIQKYWKGVPYHDCQQLDITIHKPTVQPGQVYFQAVVVHLLTKAENGGNHNEYFDAIDENDQQLRGSIIKGLNNGINLSATIDKPPNEFGTNFSVHTQDTIDAWLAEVPGIGPVAADTVKGFHTRWGGEIVGGQDYGHISIYVIWKKMTGTPPDPEEPPVSDCEELQEKYDDLLAQHNKMVADIEAILDEQ